MSEMDKRPSNNMQYTFHEAKAKFEEYINDCVKLRTGRLGKRRGEQVRRFVTWLAKNTDWYQAPASTKFHGALPGGLLMHSVGVCDHALILRKNLMMDIPADSVILCAIFHDVGKIYAKMSETGDGKAEPRYIPNVLQSGKVSDAKPFGYNPDDNGINLTIKDALLPLKWIDLSDAEIQALMGADGQYVPVNGSMQHKEHPLTLITHWADYWQGHVIEGGLQASWLSGILGDEGAE